MNVNYFYAQVQLGFYFDYNTTTERRPHVEFNPFMLIADKLEGHIHKGAKKGIRKVTNIPEKRR